MGREVSTWRDGDLLVPSIMGLVMSVTCATIWGPDKPGSLPQVALLEQSRFAQMTSRGPFPLGFCGEHHKRQRAEVSGQAGAKKAAPATLCSPNHLEGQLKQ